MLAQMCDDLNSAVYAHFLEIAERRDNGNLYHFGSRFVESSNWLTRFDSAPRVNRALYGTVSENTILFGIMSTHIVSISFVDKILLRYNNITGLLPFSSGMSNKRRNRNRMRQKLGECNLIPIGGKTHWSPTVMRAEMRNNRAYSIVVFDYHDPQSMLAAEYFLNKLLTIVTKGIRVTKWKGRYSLSHKRGHLENLTNAMNIVTECWKKNPKNLNGDNYNVREFGD